VKLDFHRDIYLPADLVAQVRAVNYSRLDYSMHAVREAEADGLRAHELPRALSLDDWGIIHVETWSGRATGVLVRRTLLSRPGWDLVLAVSVPDCRVKTVWLNETTDRHRSLDRKRYVAKPA
jgi:hypothetical protein